MTEPDPSGTYQWIRPRDFARYRKAGWTIAQDRACHHNGYGVLMEPPTCRRVDRTAILLWTARGHYVVVSDNGGQWVIVGPSAEILDPPPDRRSRRLLIWGAMLAARAVVAIVLEALFG